MQYMMTLFGVLSYILSYIYCYILYYIYNTCIIYSHIYIGKYQVCRSHLQENTTKISGKNLLENFNFWGT